MLRNVTGWEVMSAGCQAKGCGRSVDNKKRNVVRKLKGVQKRAIEDEVGWRR